MQTHPARFACSVGILDVPSIGPAHEERLGGDPPMGLARSS